MSAYDHAKREVISLGVDWITASANDTDGFRRSAERAERLLIEERAAGNEIKRACVEGYQGYGCGSFFGGALNGTFLTRASSHVAAEHWLAIYQDSSNVSRLDLQATIRYIPHVRYIAEMVERRVREKVAGTRSNLDVSLRRSLKKGNTCYIGSRRSDRYARIYDKHHESKLDEYAGCWRWEIEYKRKLSKAIAGQVATADDHEGEIAGLLVDAFARYGVGRMMPGEARRRSMKWAAPARCDSDANRVLRWLSSGVAGRVEWLIQAGYLQETLEALRLTQHVTVAHEETRHREET